jgi:NAD(P)H dehydrogenase (quinone)
LYYGFDIIKGYNMKEILVTGATGNFGRATINFLLGKGIPAKSISAMVRDEGKAADLKSEGVIIKVGDYDNYSSLVNAFKGTDTLLHISGNDIPKRTRQQENQ